MPLELADLDTAGPWGLQHLLELEKLSAAQLNTVLELADTLDHATSGGRNRLDTLKGIVVANLFFENSTRTRTSFSLAARRLGADTVDFSPSSSSLSKGETFIDTAMTIEAMASIWLSAATKLPVPHTCSPDTSALVSSMPVMAPTNIPHRDCSISSPSAATVVASPD